MPGQTKTSIDQWKMIQLCHHVVNGSCTGTRLQCSEAGSSEWEEGMNFSAIWDWRSSETVGRPSKPQWATQVNRRILSVHIRDLLCCNTLHLAKLLRILEKSRAFSFLAVESLSKPERLLSTSKTKNFYEKTSVVFTHITSMQNSSVCSSQLHPQDCWLLCCIDRGDLYAMIKLSRVILWEY